MLNLSMKIGSATNLIRCVVDTSVVVKWYSEEPDTPKALLLFDQLQAGEVEVYSPELLMYEVGNALCKKKKFTKSELSRALTALFYSGIELAPLDITLAHAALEFMIDYALTFYDSAYAALSYTMNIPLITADVKDHKKIKEIEIIELKAVR